MRTGQEISAEDQEEGGSDRRWVRPPYSEFGWAPTEDRSHPEVSAHACRGWVRFHEKRGDHHH